MYINNIKINNDNYDIFIINDKYIYIYYVQTDESKQQVIHFDRNNDVDPVVRNKCINNITS